MRGREMSWGEGAGAWDGFPSNFYKRKIYPPQKNFKAIPSARCQSQITELEPRAPHDFLAKFL